MGLTGGFALWAVLWTQLELEWHAPEPQCPPASAFTAAVARETGDADPHAPMRVTAHVLPSATGFRLTLQIDSANGEMHRVTLEDPSCAILLEAAALKVALAVESSAPIAPPRVETETEALKPRSALPVPCGVAAGAGKVPCVAVRGWAAGQLGPLPGFGPGLGGGVAVLWDRVRVEVEAHGWFERTTRPPLPRAALRLVAGSASACGRVGTAGLEVPLCGGVEVGTLLGRGVGVDVPRSDRLVWAAARLQSGFAWAPHPRIALFAQATMLINVLSMHFVVDETETVYRVPRMGGRFGAGVELRAFVPKR